MSGTVLTASRRIAALVFAAGFLCAPAEAAEVTLKLHHFLGPESAPQKWLMEPWAERIEAASGGRIAVEIHPDMTLGGKAPELVDQVEAGTVDIVWTAAAYTPGRFARTEVFTLPLVHGNDAAVTNQAIAAMLETDLAADFVGIHPLLVHVHAGHALHSAARPVASLGDFAGLSVRPPGKGIGLWTVEALGAVPTTKRHPKLARALADGELDAVLMPFDLALAMEVVDAARHHTVVDGAGFGTSLYLFLMNEARYRALPDDLRAIIDTNSSAAIAAEVGARWNNGAAAAIARAQSLGHALDVIDGATLREPLESVSVRWRDARDAEGIDGAGLIERARAAMANAVEAARPAAQ